jgi:glutaredoxin 3
VAFGTRGYEVTYFDVKKSAEALDRFLDLSGGDRRVPLIEEEGTISIGFDGGT